MRLIFSLLACLSLTACIDADLKMDFADGENLKMTADLTLARKLFDMMGKTPEGSCPNGKETLDKDSYHCTRSETLPITQVLGEGGTVESTSDFDPAKAAKIERVDDNHIRVTFEFDKLADNGKKRPEDLGGMEDMLRAAVAGHSLSFAVTGYKITSTTGTLSEDGKTASRVIPVADFLDKKPDFGAPFVTEIQLKQHCTLWIFCD